jgi:hypothetical protein
MTNSHYRATTHSRVDKMMRTSYNSFVPGSDDRARRNENAQDGFKTCDECGRPYSPWTSRDRGDKPRHSWWYCPECAIELAPRAGRPVECEGCA